MFTIVSRSMFVISSSIMIAYPIPSQDVMKFYYYYTTGHDTMRDPVYVYCTDRAGCTYTVLLDA